MKYYLLFTVVMTAITFISLFWASANDSKDSLLGKPNNDSLGSDRKSGQRKTDIDEQPNTGNSPLSNNNYMVLGLH